MNGSPALSRRGLLKALAAGGIPLPVSAADEPPIFRDVAAQTGLHFYHFNGATGRHYMPEIMGAGVALFDYDNDGDLDIYLVQGATIDAGARAATGNRLFRNDGVVDGVPHFT